MASLTEWKVPAAVQPKAQDYDYDLERGAGRGGGPARDHSGDAFTAETLGTERAGNGV